MVSLQHTHTHTHTHTHLLLILCAPALFDRCLGAVLQTLTLRVHAMDMAMQVLETRVENTFERTRAYPQELAETGRISLSQTSVSKLLGQVRCICLSWRDND